MNFIELFQKELISLAFALITAGILWFLRARVELVWATAHGFIFFLRATNPPPAQAGSAPVPAPIPPNFNVHTGSIIVANAGRVPATEVEVTFNWMPDNYNIWPVRPYDTHASPDNRFTLKFANLAPHEQFQIELISSVQLPVVLNVRCKECTGQQIPMRPMRVYPRWVEMAVWMLILLGLAAAFYLVIKIGSLFVLK